MRRRTILAVAIVPIIAFLSTFNYVEQGNAGLAWNPISGQITLQKAGMHWTAPTTLVTTVETRPQRLCLTSSAQAAPNCRLVQFEERYYKEFVAVEGWRYYWFNNRLSFNFGHPETYRGFRDVLRGYAFSAQRYPFIKTLSAQ